MTSAFQRRTAAGAWISIFVLGLSCAGSGMVLAAEGQEGAVVSALEGEATSASARDKQLGQIRAAIAEAEGERLAKTQPDPTLPDELREKWGVEVIGIDLTSGGYMLDFRFRVVDAEKALSLFDHRIKPYVLTDRAKVKLPVPTAAKVGAFRPTNRGKNIRADKTYYMVFGNPDNFVKAGEKVSVVVGDFRAENLTVR